MSHESYPKDETLRLVLTAEEDQWIRHQIKKSIGFAWAMAILLAVGAAWVAVDFSGVFSRYDEPDCFSFSDGSADNQELRNEFLAKGLKPCPPEGSVDRGINWTEVRQVATISSLAVILVSFLGLLRNLFLLRRYNGYLKDHRAFLQKYNRL